MAETTPAPAPEPVPAENRHTPLIPVILTGIGAYLFWFGVHYWRSDVTWPTDPIKDVLQGKPLPDNSRNDVAEVTNAVAPATASVASGVSAVTGSVIADQALKYQGAGYVYGGKADRIGDWDCSSFVSKVLGQDLGMALPGGHWGDPGFPPNSHGPTTLNYMIFGTGVELSQVRPGDLIVSVEHIGIAISTTQMISAQSPSLGTRVSDFPADFPSGPPIYRRVR